MKATFLEGGWKLDQVGIEKRLKSLVEIEGVNSKALGKEFNWSNCHSMACMFIAVCIGIAAFWLNEKLDWGVVAGGVALSCVGFLTLKQGPLKSQTWDEKLFELVKAYDPVNKTAYEYMFGKLSVGSKYSEGRYHLVELWLRWERQSLMVYETSTFRKTAFLLFN